MSSHWTSLYYILTTLTYLSYLQTSWRLFFSHSSPSRRTNGYVSISSVRVSSCVWLYGTRAKSIQRELAAGFSLSIYDTLLTFSEERHLIWSKRWSTTKVLYLINRYGIIVLGLGWLICESLRPTLKVSHSGIIHSNCSLDRNDGTSGMTYLLTLWVNKVY
jgi:hypothetical protein